MKSRLLDWAGVLGSASKTSPHGYLKKRTIHLTNTQESAPTLSSRSMNVEFNISPKKKYEVELTEVRCTYRVRYNCQALQMYFYIKELDKTTSRTFDIPKTLKPLNNVFTDMVGNIVDEPFDDSLLDKPNILAKEVFKQLSSKKLNAKLNLSTNGKFIDVVEVEPA